MRNHQLDFIGSSVEEAIEKGLSIFNRTRDHVDIEVLDQGSKGIFGIGAKPAKVRISLKPGDSFFDDPEEETFEDAPAESTVSVPVAGMSEHEVKASQIEDEPDALTREAKKDVKTKPSPESLVETVAQAEPSKKEAENVVEPDDDEDESSDTVKTYPDRIVNENSLQIAIAVVKELLEHMRIKANVEGRIGVQELGSNQPCILIDIKGDDLSYLIGRQSETLNAFQYITSLIVGRENGHWVPLQIDIQGYRARRERQLRQMSVRMADQVAKSGRKISLEPMPGPERRIIHMLLRDRSDVYTESTGEEPNRKVVILPRETAAK